MKYFNRIKFIPLAGIVLLLLAGCGGGGGGSTATGGGGTGGEVDSFSQLFSATVAHPRCVNCHAFAEGGQTADMHRERSSDCSSCHNQNDFRQSTPDMTFTSQSASQICNTSVNRRGSTEALATLLRTSPHVAWAISDGSITSTGQRLPLAPPQNQSAWLALVDRWVAAGSSCQ